MQSTFAVPRAPGVTALADAVNASERTIGALKRRN
jgi:hypothetical protein